MKRDIEAQNKVIAKKKAIGKKKRVEEVSALMFCGGAKWR